MGGAGGNAGLAVSGGVSVDSGQVSVVGGNAGYGVADGSTEASGGNAGVSLGSLTITSNNFHGNGNGGQGSLIVTGGAGGADGDSGNGGDGGDAVLAVSGAVSVDSSGISLGGGAGGNSDFAGGGNGGVASVFIGSALALTAGHSSSYLMVDGGIGGQNQNTGQGTGGAGGSAVLTVSAGVSMDSSVLDVNGGNATFGYGQSGVTQSPGGNASVSLGSLTLTSNNYFSGPSMGVQSSFSLMAGAGGSDYGSGDGGQGGDTDLAVSGAVSVDSSSVSVAAGTGGISNSANGGNGGNAAVSIGSNLALTAILGSSDFQVSGAKGGFVSSSSPDNGGSGGNVVLSVGGSMSVDSSGVSVAGGAGGADGGSGIGGQGGNAALTVSGTVSLDSSNLSLTGGEGGTSVNGLGGNGGGVTLALGSAFLNHNSGLTLTGGNGGSGTAAGNGGNTSVSIGTLNLLDSGSTLSITGGTGLASGNASVTLGILNGAGSLAIYGSGLDALQVSSGNFSGIIAGNATLDKTGTGALTLTGNNSYTGATTLSGGILNILGPSNLGTSALLDFNGGTLQAGAAITTTLAAGLGPGGGTVDLDDHPVVWNGVLSGTGALSVMDSTNGNSALILTAANSYSGGTQINSGTLVVANAGALGSGNVSVNGGTLSTDGVNHSLNVAGNYTQASGGTLQLGLGGTATGQWDLLNVGGTAQLAGTLRLVSEDGFYFRRDETFELVDSGGALTGQFGSILDEAGGVPVSLVYMSHEILLETLAPVYASLGRTPNEKAVGGALDSLSEQPYDSKLITLMDASASTPAVTGNLDALSPANLTAIYQMAFSLAQAHAEILDRHLSSFWTNSGSGSKGYSWDGQGPLFASSMPAPLEAALAANRPPDQWEVFTTGVGDFATVSGDGNAAGYQYSIGGAVAGMDRRFSKDFMAGLLLGYSQSGTSQSAGQVNATGAQAGLYAAWKLNAFHLEGLAEAGFNNYTLQRSGLGGLVTGNTQGSQVTGELGAGYDFKLDQARVGLFATGQITGVNIGAFDESGSLAPLAYGAQGETSLTSSLGAKASRSWNVGGGVVLSPSLNACWEHVVEGNLDSLTASFAGMGNSASFTVDGPALGTNAALLGGGLDARFNRDLGAFVAYQGKLGMTHYGSQDVLAGLNFGF
jgi:autotransporter-associated beta strand protein